MKTGKSQDRKLPIKYQRRKNLCGRCMFESFTVLGELSQTKNLKKIILVL